MKKAIILLAVFLLCALQTGCASVERGMDSMIIPKKVTIGKEKVVSSSAIQKMALEIEIHHCKKSFLYSTCGSKEGCYIVGRDGEEIICVSEDADWPIVCHEIGHHIVAKVLKSNGKKKGKQEKAKEDQLANEVVGYMTYDTIGKIMKKKKMELVRTIDAIGKITEEKENGIN